MKNKIKIKNINISKIKKLSFRLFSVISSVFIINGFPKNIDYELDEENFYNSEFTYILDSKSLICNKTIDDDNILNLGINIDKFKSQFGNIEQINIQSNNFITDLSYLEPIYSDIKKLTIINCSSIIDLSSIYYMDNLEEVYITECPGTNRELVEYLNNKSIKHNITEQDVYNSEKIDNILSITINNEMTDEEKINNICTYIIKNYSYDLKYTKESNKFPITCFFKYKQGVCASYAYLANILFRKAGINSYEIMSLDHGWNLVEINNKYYYIDITNIDNSIDEFMLEYFNFGTFYLTDPGENEYSCMVNYLAGKDKILISKSLVNKVIEGEKLKNIFEKNPLKMRDYFVSLISLIIIYNLLEKIIALLKPKKEVFKISDNYVETFKTIKLQRKTLK